jgi:HD-like signal output (HDOD) protein
MLESRPDAVGLTAKILQLVNSAFFGARQPILNIRKGVAFLGTNLIHQLVLGAEALGNFGAVRKVPGFSIDEEQHHAIAAGRLAPKICPDPSRTDEAAMAAVLHDVGHLVLAMSIPDEYAAATASGE